MIPINELRIGNCIDEQGLYLQVGMIHQGLFDASEPILLTDEILTEWCGLNHSWCICHHVFSKGGFSIENFGAGYGLSGRWEPRIKFLHELQNLYFLIMGEELPIKLPKQ